MTRGLLPLVLTLLACYDLPIPDSGSPTYPFVGDCEVLSATPIRPDELPSVGPGLDEVMDWVNVERTAVFSTGDGTTWEEPITFEVIAAAGATELELAPYPDNRVNVCVAGTYVVVPVSVEVIATHFGSADAGEGAVKWAGPDLGTASWFDFNVDVLPDPWLVDAASPWQCPPTEPLWHIGASAPLPEPPWAALEVSLGVFGDHCASQAARNDGVWVDGP